MQAHPQLGTRRICPKCRAPHYDLNKNPSVCPKCSFSYDPTQPYEPVKRGRKAAKRIEDSKENIKENALEESMESDEEETNVSAPDIEHIEDLDDRADEEMSGIASKAGSSVDGDDDDSTEGGSMDGLIDDIDDDDLDEEE